ncbi:MAG: hypothetical protein M1823_006127 [Watsoniomyces obsoletus]|nr:MAG: hypothetical protein M1823_006127 [Watsoniomyces obsoletus]
MSLSERTFGELIADAHDAVDVEAALGLPSNLPEAPSGWGDVQVSSAHSLGTVLNQALKTNDVPLLETCLQSQDLTSVRATIQRLQPTLATTLLSKLAERMHRRPARAGSLMVWIQWTLIAHGGYLAGQPEVMRQLAALHDVLQDRARALQPLLALKGKLDMLQAQMQLRKSMQRVPIPDGEGEDVDDEDEEAIIYVEGQDESADSDDALPDPDVEMVDVGDDDSLDEDDEDDDEDDHDKKPNGLAVGRHETSDGSSSEDEGFIDDEADETDADTGEDRDEEDDDDEDEMGSGLDAGESLDGDDDVTAKR